MDDQSRYVGLNPVNLIIAAVFLAVLGTLVVRDWFTKDYALLRHGTAATATVTGLFEAPVRGQYSISYRLVVGDKVYESGVSVSAREYRALAEGGDVAVVYLAARPSVNAPRSQIRPAGVYLKGIMLLALVGTGAGLLAWLTHKFLKLAAGG